MIDTNTIVGGKYKLQAAIGEGGMGSVWRAVHVQLERLVAIKFIKPEVNTPEIAARFLREAKSTAAIRHRNVIDVIDYGQTDEGLPYIVMELLEGQSLGQRLGTPPPPTTSEIISILADALNGLTAVHAKGIIHRDLKPDNVFIVEEPEGPVPKLVDFGISRSQFVGAETGERAKLTSTGTIVGTPYYMSPEQVRGAKDIDARTDVYSMGVILFEALTGRLPFQADTLGGLMVQIATEQAPPPTAMRPEVGDALSDVVCRAMANQKENRFASAREMREALLAASRATSPKVLKSAPPPPSGGSLAPPPTRQALSQAQLKAQPKAQTPQAWASAVGPSPTPTGRHKSLWIALAGAAVLVVGGVGVTLGLSGGDRAAPAARSVQVPPPPAAPAHLTVHLRGLPAGALVRLDGAAATGPEMQMPRDGRVRRIDVDAPGYGPWHVEHTATLDGDYAVQMQPMSAVPPIPATSAAATAEAQPPSKGSTRRRSSRSSSSRPRKSQGFVVDPGF